MPSPPCKMAGPQPQLNAPGGCSAPSAGWKPPNGRDPFLRADPARDPDRAADRGVGVRAPDAGPARDARAGGRVAGEGDRRSARARHRALARRGVAAAGGRPARANLACRHRSRPGRACHRLPPRLFRRPPSPTIPDPRIVARPRPPPPPAPTPVRPASCSVRAVAGRATPGAAGAAAPAAIAARLAPPPPRAAQPSSVRLGEPRRREPVPGGRRRGAGDWCRPLPALLGRGGLAAAAGPRGHRDSRRRSRCSSCAR